MNKTTRRVTLVILIFGGIGCIITAIIVPVVAPIMAPVGCVLLGGGFGMFQSVITAAENKEAQQQRPNNAEEAQPQEIHIDHNISLTNSPVTMLFLYDNHRENNALFVPAPEIIHDPSEIVRPSKALALI